MNLFDKQFLKIITEAIESKKLQKLIDAIYDQNTKEIALDNKRVIKWTCVDISRIVTPLEINADEYNFSETERTALHALNDITQDFRSNIEEYAKKLPKDMTDKNFFLKIMVPTAEEKYKIKIPETIIKKISDALFDNRFEYFVKSKIMKNSLQKFFSKIDAANITDNDIIELNNLNELNRKERAKYSIVACFIKDTDNHEILAAIIYFNDDGTIQGIDNFYSRYEKLNVKKLNSICNYFIGIINTKISDATQKLLTRRDNSEYVNPLPDDEIAYNNRIKNKFKLLKMKEQREFEQESKEIPELLKEIENLIKEYDPELETSLGNNLLDNYKKLKKSFNNNLYWKDILFNTKKALEEFKNKFI